MILKLIELAKAIPTLLPLLEQLVAFAKKNFGEDWKKVTEDATTAFQQLNEAKSPQDKVEAGKKLQDIFSKLNVIILVLFVHSFAALVLSSCASLHPEQAPLKVDICISDPVNKGFQCVRPDKSNYSLLYTESENYVCYSPAGAKAITQRLIECKESQAFCVPQK